MLIPVLLSLLVIVVIYLVLGTVAPTLVAWVYFLKEDEHRLICGIVSESSRRIGNDVSVMPERLFLSCPFRLDTYKQC